MTMNIPFFLHTIRHSRAGFTLVETLVAIAILMISIAGPLTIANKALTAAINARNTMIATNLAEDGMEYVKNIKDNNVTTQTDWLYALTDGSTCFDEGAPCTIPTAESGGPFTQAIAVCNPSSTCRLYEGGRGYHYYTGSDPQTPFSRYFFMTHVPLAAGGNDPDQVLVTVVVDWNQGSVPNEVRLQEVMTDNAR